MPDRADSARRGWYPSAFAQSLANLAVIELGYRLVHPLLTAIDAERAHHIAIAALRLIPTRGQEGLDDQRLVVHILGRTFPNPVGLAAGFDKDGVAIAGCLELGFGFVEVGGVTPLPQPGNARPRLFRLARDQAVINRYGLNNAGVQAMAERLEARTGEPGLVGINVGANRTSNDRAGDYAICIAALAGLCAFITINVSSPNTPGMRRLQAKPALDELVARAVEARDRAIADRGERTPLLVKIAPDLTLAELDHIVAVCLSRGIDGLVVSNTTITRPPGLKETSLAREEGGLSGRPLFALSTGLLAETFLRVERKLPLMGVGGIDCPESAWMKIKAGATLVQLYTALVFKGPAIAGKIKRGLAERVSRAGLSNITEAVGTEARELAGALRS
jgi:dihydroorotate dehydrogenase